MNSLTVSACQISSCVRSNWKDMLFRLEYNSLKQSFSIKIYMYLILSSLQHYNMLNHVIIEQCHQESGDKMMSYVVFELLKQATGRH